MFGTCVAETILASVHVRTQQQAGHMDASDQIKLSRNILRVGGRPHKGSELTTLSGFVTFSIIWCFLAAFAVTIVSAFATYRFVD